MQGRLDSSILTVLADAGPATGPELAATLGVHPQRVQRRCQTLQQRGRLRKTTGGLYVLADRQPGPRSASD
jgi:DNA-binding IclR family transcriptional regulator